MAEQALFCVADDRHRAVLLAGCMADLGYPVVQLHEPSDTLEQPALVLWTRRAAERRWTRELFLRDPEMVALVIDDVPLPQACKRAVALQRWPARSADTNINALVNWLQNPTVAPEPFMRNPRRAPEREPDKAIVLSVLALVVAVLVGLMLTSNSEEAIRVETPTAIAAPVREVPGLVQSAEGTSRRSGSNTVQPAGSLIAVDPSNPPELNPLAGVTALDTTVEDVGPMVADEPTATDAEFADDSLSHLCRAKSLAAAIAWYRVLTPRQRRQAADLACVKKLLLRPGFEVLREEIQA